MKKRIIFEIIAAVLIVCCIVASVAVLSNRSDASPENAGNAQPAEKAPAEAEKPVIADRPFPKETGSKTSQKQLRMNRSPMSPPLHMTGNPKEQPRLRNIRTTPWQGSAISSLARNASQV